ncbi:MAG: RNA-binding protein [Clostridia bacterium]|nr:RNA-binding protein [Clostridia bacterium]
MADAKNRLLEVGTVVRSKTGRDRKRVFLVIGIDEKNITAPVIIANGTLRKIEDSKHKNPAHLEYVGAIVESVRKELAEDFTNSKIAEICSKHDNRDIFA